MSLSQWDWRVSGFSLEGLGSRNCLAGLRDVCAPMGRFRLTFGGSLVRNARFADNVSLGGSLVRNARFGDLARDFWRKSRTKRSFWRLDM